MITRRNDITNEKRFKCAGNAIEVLKVHRLNIRLVSELLSHPDAESLFGAIEVYIDRKIHPQVKTMNAVYKMAEDTLKANFDVADNKERIGCHADTVR